MKKTARLLLLLTALCLLLCSCTSLGYVYPNADKYTAGGARIDQRVEDIDINWVDGMVTIEYHNGNEIILKETEKEVLSAAAILLFLRQMIRLPKSPRIRPNIFSGKHFPMER